MTDRAACTIDEAEHLLTPSERRCGLALLEGDQKFPEIRRNELCRPTELPYPTTYDVLTPFWKGHEQRRLFPLLHLSRALARSLYHHLLSSFDLQIGMPHSMKYLSTRGGEERLSFEEVSWLFRIFDGAGELGGAGTAMYGAHGGAHALTQAIGTVTTARQPPSTPDDEIWRDGRLRRCNRRGERRDGRCGSVQDFLGCSPQL